MEKGPRPDEHEMHSSFRIEGGDISDGIKEIAESLENPQVLAEEADILKGVEAKNERDKKSIGTDLVLLGNEKAPLEVRKAALDRLRSDGLRIAPDDDETILNTSFLADIYRDSGNYLLDNTKIGDHVNAAAWLMNAREDLATEAEVKRGTKKTVKEETETMELPATGKKEKTKAPATEEDLTAYFKKIHDIGNLDIEDRLLNNLVNTYVESEMFELLALVAKRKNELEEDKARLKREETAKNIEGLPKNIKSETEWRQWARARLTQVLVNGGRFTRDVFGAVSENAVFGGRQEIDGSLYMPGPIADEVKGKIRPDGSLEIKGEKDVAEELGKAIFEWRKAHKKMPQMVAAYDAMGKGGEYEFPKARLLKFIFNDLKGEDGTPEGGSKNVAKALQLYWAMAHLDDREERVVVNSITGKIEQVRTSESIMAETILAESGVFEAFLKAKKLVAENVDFSKLSASEARDFMALALKEFKSIFNSQIPVEEVDLTRAVVAKCCGGTFYENIGLYFAGVYGITAWGSNSIAPGIENNDAMGLMIHTESQRFMERVQGKTPVVNEKDRLSAGKRSVRYLDDVVANALNVYDKDESPIRIQVSWKKKRPDGTEVIETGWDFVPVILGKYSGIVQEQKDAEDEKFFYVIRKRGEEKFRIIKSVKALEETERVKTPIIPDQQGRVRQIDQLSPNDAIYEEVTLDQLIREGRMNEIDWEASLDLSGLLTLRESKAVGIWKLFKNLEDDLTKLTLPDLVGKKENFEDCLPNYNQATRQHTAYLWLYSLLSKNRSRIATLAPDMKRVISEAIKAELISGRMGLKLRMEFKLI